MDLVAPKKVDRVVDQLRRGPRGLRRTIAARGCGAAPALAAVVALGLAGCGGSSATDAGAGAGAGGAKLARGAVAEVGSTAISRSTLERWMSVLAGEYYNEKVGGSAPRELAVPAACVSDVESFAAKQSPADIATFTAKCDELSRAMGREAMTYLIEGQWVADESAEVGVKDSPEEFQAFYAHVKAEHFPTEADLQKYLSERGLTLSEELTSLKEEALAAKLFQALSTRGAQGTALRKKWLRLTSCRAGYVVEQCSQYKAGSATTGSSAAVLLEQIGDLHPPRPNPLAGEDQLCHNAKGGKGYVCVAVPVHKAAAKGSAKH